ncbi:MAG: uroporphyrinogen-III C-methyltransferase [Mariniblastus sp.]
MICRRGSVYLVGAGPGDPELITVRGMRLIQQADTIIYDRLIPSEVLNWARETASLIDVGKYPDHHRVSQAEINELLVRHAGRGEIVVRLKGGDPFVFGRGQEEINACRAANIPVHIVPGVSSAIAGPAAAGIPVTSRGIARSFAVVTGQTAPELAKHDLDFEAMSKIDTVVLLMARKNLRKLAASLIKAGRDPETPVACIERATFSDQRVTYATLYGVADQVDQLKMANPMVTVIGDVAKMVNSDLVEWPAETNEHFYAFEFGE